MSAPDTAAKQTATAINLRIAEELKAAPGQVRAAVELLDDGATVPFIARYRKEVTGGLDDTQLRTLEERLSYLRELEERRATILESIDSQGKLDDALRAQILAADSKARLEDIYLPFKPKRRTKAQIAREAGLEPLADALLADRGQDRGSALLKLPEVAQALVQGPQLRVVQGAGGLLAVPGDERHGRAAVEQLDRGADLPDRHAELPGDPLVHRGATR